MINARIHPDFLAPHAMSVYMLPGRPHAGPLDACYVIALALCLNERGQLTPLIYDAELHLVDGHHRRAALKLLAEFDRSKHAAMLRESPDFAGCDQRAVARAMAEMQRRALLQRVVNVRVSQLLVTRDDESEFADALAVHRRELIGDSPAWLAATLDTLIWLVDFHAGNAPFLRAHVAKHQATLAANLWRRAHPFDPLPQPSRRAFLQFFLPMQNWLQSLPGDAHDRRRALAGEWLTAFHNRHWQLR